MLKKLLVFTAIVLASATVRAQVVQASRGHIPPVYLGGSFSDFSPDYTLDRLYGFGAYLDVVPLRFNHVNLGLEGELHALNLNQHVHVHERSLSIGPIVSYDNFHGFQPFAKFMYGLGNFYYPYRDVRPSFYTDSFGIYVFGGGVDYKLHHRLTLRGEYEYQNYTHFRGAKTLNPTGPSVGISYQLF